MLDSIDQKHISVGTRCRRGGGGQFILPGIKNFNMQENCTVRNLADESNDLSHTSLGLTIVK